jgi:methyl-accepting chemotaxis protein
MTIVRRIVLGYVTLIFFGVTLLGVGVGAVFYQRAVFHDYTENTTARLTAAHEFIEGESRMGHYALLAVGVQERRTDFATLVDMIYVTTVDSLDKARALETDAATLAQLDSIQGLLSQYHQDAVDAIAVAATNEQQAWADIGKDAVPLAQEINAAATAYLGQVQVAADARHARGDRMANILAIVLIAVGCVGIAVAVIMSILISRGIARRLRSFTAGLSSSAAELLAIAAQVSAGASQTAASTNETTATVEEVKQTAQLAHEKATRVADKAQALAQLAETGRGSVDGTVGGIEQMQIEMGVVSETISRLSEQARTVGDIITTVSDLAEQSNLLSVNASIEAAKAGDYGKGFTVVAQEVKSLAEQSKQAVVQVRTILNEIHKASNRAVEAAEQSQQAIEAARQQSVQTGDAAASVASTASEAAEAAVQISASSRQQLAGMEQISQAIESISAATGQSVSGTRQVEQEVKQLQELATQIRQLVDGAATA